MAQSVIDAIFTWKRLKSGQQINLKSAKNLYSKIKSQTKQSSIGIKRGFKQLKNTSDDDMFTMKNLKEDHGLLSDGDWYDVLDNVDGRDLTYIRRLEQIGEKIDGDPRIKVSTIHMAKGGECDNVVVLTDLGPLVYKSYLKNPDDEHRVFYVAVTRAKHNLHIIEPQKKLGYRIYGNEIN